MKTVQVPVFFGPNFPVIGMNTGKYGTKTTLYLDTFHPIFP